MRIIDENRKDYYDCIQSYGQDDLVYLRKEEEVFYQNYPFPQLERHIHSSCPSFSSFTVGFCGIRYPGLIVWDGENQKQAYCYKTEDVDELVEGLSKRYRTAYQGKKRYKRPTRYWVDEYFVKSRIRKENDQFFEKAPIFVAYGPLKTVTYNAILKSWEFYRIFDPYMAFQELSMWMSNQTKPFSPIPLVSDADLCAAKGFDEFSFRKPKTKR